MELKEKLLFPPLKKHFKDLGYKVYAEVPCFYRGVDFVAAKGEDHIAVEMKTSFNNEVIAQASGNILSFGKSYVAFPVKKFINFANDDIYWNLRESTQERIRQCESSGIGIIQVVGVHQIIVTVLESVYKKPYRVFDFSQYREGKNDEAGLPYQKGVSAGYMELKAIKRYVKKHPQCNWKEIYENVQNHYSSHTSLSGSMSQWRGFSLLEYKKSLGFVIEKKEIIKIEPVGNPLF